MASTKMVKAINAQINAETYSAYLYLAMSAWAANAGLPGTAKWLFVQGQEELTHSWRFYLYLIKIGQPVVLEAIAKPPAVFKTAEGLFEEVLKHEKKVTALINDLVNLARADKDHATDVFLQWFVNEQVEEEENVNNILSQLRLAGDKGGGLFMIDKELAARAFVMPPDLAAAAV